jgi:2-keto-3-deoxy-L-rhamnonate aldolase RhmA
MSQEPQRPWFAPTYVPDGYEETWDDALKAHLREKHKEGYVILLDAILATPGVDVILAAAIELGFDQGVEITRYRD